MKKCRDDGGNFIETFLRLGAQLEFIEIKEHIALQIHAQDRVRNRLHQRFVAMMRFDLLRARIRI